MTTLLDEKDLPETYDEWFEFVWGRDTKKTLE